jgi:tripartite-type tricarboxylate transporter receptor subunit TctC
MNATLRVLAFAAASLLCTAVFAQAYPTRPIRFITVGADDAMPRILAQEISGPLGQQVYIEEHPGASGTIGAEAGARAPADGYSFLVVTSAHMVTPHFYKLSYDIMRDFEPVVLMAATPFVLLAHPSLPVKNLQDLIKLAQAKAGRLNYSSTAAGSSTMLFMEMFKANAKVNIVHVPYKSVAAALTDVVAGQVDLGSSVEPNALAQIRSGRVRALAVSTATRSTVLPDVPTVMEQGVNQVPVSAWFGLLAPAKTPAAAITRMNTEVMNALRKQSIRERILTLALEPMGSTPEEMRAHMKADLERWTEAVKSAKLTGGVQR